MKRPFAMADVCDRHRRVARDALGWTAWRLVHQGANAYAKDIERVAQFFAEQEERSAERIRALEAELAELRKRDEDVRTLDEWRVAGRERKFEEFDFTSTEDVPRRIFVFSIDTNNEPPGRFAHECYRGTTTGEARAKAAAWVRAEREKE